jgi:N-acetylmuramoyl-L-alanine amidase
VRRRPGARAASLALALGVALAAGAAVRAAGRTDADSARVPAGLGVPWAPVARVDGVPMLGVNDLARLLGASRTWRADVRRMTLRSGGRHLTLTADNPFVIVEDRTLRLEHPVRSNAGELHVPVELVDLLPRGAGWPQLSHDAAARRVRVAPRDGFVGSPRVTVAGGRTLLEVPCERAEGAAVVARSRARFRLRLPGALAGELPDTLPEHALVRDVSATRSAGGVTLELGLDPAAAGFRFEADAARRRVLLSFAALPEPGFESFASEGAPGPRTLRMVVIDPGHGGSDAGVQVEGAAEKALALELAQRVAEELERRAGTRVYLTRRDDRDLAQETRAEAANRARADLVLSLHVGAYPGGRARGALAWCAPATRTAGAEASARASGLVLLLPWRDAALERAVESRALAESVTGALERAGVGPAEVRERLPLALVGVQSPGILLECGSLTQPEDRARLLSQAGQRDLARAIADGVLAWRQGG